MRKLIATDYTVRCKIDAPLTFALVTDLHLSPHEPVIRMIKERGVDFIAVAGDIVNRMDTDSEAAGVILRAFAAAGRVFYVTGNHDLPQNAADEEMIKESGVVYFDNSCGKFEINGVRLNIGGLSTIYDQQFLTGFSGKSGFKLLLCHHPEYYPLMIKQTAVDLTVSGHAHGGQWRFFGHGVYAPGQGIFPKYTCGVYENRLIVSRGLCNNAYVPRIMNPFEVVFVRLEPER